MLAFSFSSGAVLANPSIDVIVTHVGVTDEFCHVSYEFYSSMDGYCFYLYRSDTLDQYGNVPALPENLVGSVIPEDAFETASYDSGFSGVISYYHYTIIDLPPTDGIWYYQLYCDYGSSGYVWPIWIVSELNIENCRRVTHKIYPVNPLE
jgi:hypothetical protein